MVIERIEGDIVLIELDNGDYIEVSKNNFPENIKEGDCVLKSSDGYVIDVKKTSELREGIIELQNSLWN